MVHEGLLIFQLQEFQMHSLCPISSTMKSYWKEKNSVLVTTAMVSASESGAPKTTAFSVVHTILDGSGEYFMFVTETTIAVSQPCVVWPSG